MLRNVKINPDFGKIKTKSYQTSNIICSYHNKIMQLAERLWVWAGEPFQQPPFSKITLVSLFFLCGWRKGGNLYFRKKQGAPCLYLNQAASSMAVFLKHHQRRKLRQQRMAMEQEHGQNKTRKEKRGWNLVLGPKQCNSAVTPAFEGLETKARD